MEEMRTLEKNGTWELVSLLRGKNPVGYKWVFTIKYKANGSMERQKGKTSSKELYTNIWYSLPRDICIICKNEHNHVLPSLAANLR